MPWQVDRAARRILGAQLHLHASRDADEHRALARSVAARSMVLLENDPVDGARLLPLEARALGSLAVLGHRPVAAAPLDGLRAALPGVEIVHVAADEPGLAADAARQADVAVVVVRSERHGACVEPVDAEVVRAVATANPRTVVALAAAGAVTVEAWRGSAPAILVSWHAGAEGGHALADVLLGRVDVSGRLPFGSPVESTAPASAFPLGFGLSYTEFELSDFILGDLDGDLFDAVVTVTNVGARAGRTVVQLYGRVDADDVSTRVLLGFETIGLGSGAGAQVRLTGSTMPLLRSTEQGLRAADVSVVIEAASFAGDPEALTAPVALRLG